MKTVSLTLDEIYYLANKTLISNGCDKENAEACSFNLQQIV